MYICYERFVVLSLVDLKERGNHFPKGRSLIGTTKSAAAINS